MFYTRSGRGPTKKLVVMLVCGAALLSPAVATASPDAGAGPESRCPGKACIVIEYEEPVAREAARLADTLRIRLSSFGVRVVAEQVGERTTAPSPGNAELFWVVHLRRLSSELLLVAIDSLGGAGAEDVVREVARGETDESTIWTISLMVEEAVLPYFEKEEDWPAVGAGLAIIEPPAVGGVAKPEAPLEQVFPKLHLLGLGVVVVGLVATGDFAVGPVLTVEGRFAPRFLAAFSIGWSGFAEYSEGIVSGRAQYIPMQIRLGYGMYVSRAVELSAWTGLSMGFAVYGSEADNGGGSPRTDVLFEPGVLAALRLSFTVYGPFACYLRGGATIFFVRDVLENRGTTIYEAGWVAPDVEVGVQLKF
ncbi:MAG: hypothetical protein M0R80_15785 [Proteobacteria bacterium]|jgi:hypothetical protein|nr:hypothetical protein [Pseudomonadota bacterium]